MTKKTNLELAKLEEKEIQEEIAEAEALEDLTMTTREAELLSLLKEALKKLDWYAWNENDKQEAEWIAEIRKRISEINN